MAKRALTGRERAYFVLQGEPAGVAPSNSLRSATRKVVGGWGPASLACFDGEWACESSGLSVRLGTVAVMTDVTYAAAWVPDDDPERSWDDAAELAVNWVLEEAQRQGAQPLLVTATQNQWNSGPDVITRFARIYQATTLRSNRPTGGRGPVLAYVPDYELMQQASSYARGSSLAVVESQMHPLIGWALESRALNLLTGETTPDTRTESQRTELGRIHFYGNNGWTRGFGRDQATRILRDLRGQGVLSPDVILGYMVAKGHGGKAIDRLAKIIDDLS